MYKMDSQFFLKRGGGGEEGHSERENFKEAPCPV